MSSILDDLKVERFEGTLNNGIHVLLLYRKGAPIATSAILKSGSLYDPENTPGLAHFIEHMIANGSSEFTSKDILAEHIESVGGAFGAKTSQEFLWIDTEISDKSDYRRVVDIFNATLCKPLMDKKVFENEKKIVIKEIQRSLSNPSQLQWKAAKEIFFKGTVLEHQILGDEKTVQSIQYDNMMKLHAELFDVTRVTFVASGDISIEELVTHLNMLTFIDEFPFNKKSILENDHEFEKVLTIPFDTTQTHIVFGTPAPLIVSDDMVKLNLLGDIIAGGRNSRLTKRLRYEKGLVYGVGCGTMGVIERSQWLISTETSEDKVQEVLDEIILEIKNLQNNGVTEKELDFVKNKKIKSLRRHTQTSESLVNFYAMREAYNSNHTRDMDTFVHEVENTTTSDIKNIIDKYFKKEKWQLAMVGRTKADSVILNW